MIRYIIIFFILSLHLFVIYKNGWYYGGGDNLWYFLNKNYIDNIHYLISKNDFGILNNHSLYSTYAYIFGNFNQSFIQIFTYTAITFGKLLFCFLFISNLLKRDGYNEKKYLFASSIGTLFYVFNPLTLQRFFHLSFSAFQLFLPLFLLLGLMILKNFKVSNYKLILGASLTYMFLFIPFLITNPPYLLLVIISTLGFLAFYFKFINTKRLILFFIISLLISLPYILSYLFFLIDSGNLNTPTGGAWFWTHRNAQLLNILTGKGTWAFSQDYYNFFNYYNSIAYSISFLIVIAFSILTNLFHKSKSGLTLLALILILLSTGVQKPFGFLYVDLINNVPGFFLFRESAKFLPLFYFVVSILLSYAIAINGRKNIFSSLSIFLILLSIIPFFQYSYLIKKNDETGVSTSFRYPKYLDNYEDIYKNNRTLLLPVSTNYQVGYDFGFRGVEDVENRIYSGEIINSPDGYLFDSSLKSKISKIYSEICNLEEIKELSISQISIRKYINLYNEQSQKNNINLYSEINNCGLWEKYYDDDKITFYRLKDPLESKLTKINNTSFLYDAHIKDNFNLVFPYLFNNDWTLNIGNKEIYAEQFRAYNYANGWILSNQMITSFIEKSYSQELEIEGYPKNLENGKIDYKYYVKNLDGSIDTELRIYFKPQSYFIFTILISFFTYILVISGISFQVLLNSINKKGEEK